MEAIIQNDNSERPVEVEGMSEVVSADTDFDTLRVSDVPTPPPAVGVFDRLGRLMARQKARDDAVEAEAFANFIAVVSESTDRERELFAAGFEAGRNYEFQLWREEE